MAAREFLLDNGQIIKIYKRKGNKNLKLSISAKGKVRISIPQWAPYKAGIQFAKARQSWIAEQLPRSSQLANGQAVGKAHRLKFLMDYSTKVVSSRIKDGEVIIKFPPSIAEASTEVQHKAHSASIRALRQQAESLLPQRLAQLAMKYNYNYGNVSVKQLKGRWGSCDQKKNIVLNLYLMQLPWDLIDYVLLHELAHTEVMRHGPDFWSKLQESLPQARAVSKQLKDYKPVLDS